MKKLQILCILFIFSTVHIAQWKPIDSRFPNLSGIKRIGTHLFISDTLKGVLRSDDTGITWDSVNTGLKSRSILSLGSSGTDLFAGTSSSLHYTTNGGFYWWEITGDIKGRKVTMLFNSATALWAGTDSGVYKLKKIGDKWIASLFKHGDSLIVNTGEVFGLASINDTLYVSSYYGIYKFIGNELKKMRQGPMDGIINNSIFVKDSLLFLGYNGAGVYYSFDYARNWIMMHPSGDFNYYISSLAVYKQFIFAGTNNKRKGGIGVLQSSDNCQTWSKASDGLSDLNISKVFVFEDSIYAVSQSKGIFVRALTEITTSVESNETVTSQYSLTQNYPNPFNPSTTIRYSIPEASIVTLKVYDLLGKEVKTLLNEFKSSGVYDVEFNGAELPSGMYVYTLQAGGYRESKKLILIK